MKLFFLLLFLVFSISIYSQSKIETENWIITKFEKWKIDFNEPNLFNEHFSQLYVEKPISLRFIGCEMILKTSRSYTYSKFSQNRIYTINVGDIENFNWIDGGNFYITSRKSNIKTTYNSKTEFNKSVAICFNINAEENFKNRILKAFNYLKTFCTPTFDEKEIF